MKRLYVVMCEFEDGEWDICDFTDFEYASTRFHKAHGYKNEIQQYLKARYSKKWVKRCFKVVEFTQNTKIKE